MSEEERYEAFRRTMEREGKLRALRQRVELIRSRGSGAAASHSAVIWALLDYIKDGEVTAIIQGKESR